MLVGGAAAGWPRVARAQQSTMPVIGFLKNTAAEASTFQVAAFRRGLREMGYDEDRNVSIEYHYVLATHFSSTAAIKSSLLRRAIEYLRFIICVNTFRLVD